MKRFLYLILTLISFVISVIYIKFFNLNVLDMARSHLERQIYIPANITAFSVLLFCIMLKINQKRKIDKILFIIPLIFFTAAVITLFIGYNTPCPYCI